MMYKLKNKQLNYFFQMDDDVVGIYKIITRQGIGFDRPLLQHDFYEKIIVKIKNFCYLLLQFALT